MRKNFVLLVLFFLSTAIFFGCCQEYDKDEDQNSPLLDNVIILSDGNLLYDGYRVEQGEKLDFFLNYSDKDCDINGGQIWLSWNDGPFEAIAQIAAGDGCMGQWPESKLGFFRTIVETGTINFSVSISDSGGNRSNNVLGAIETGYGGGPIITGVKWLDSYILLGEAALLSVSACDMENDLLGGQIFLYKHQAPAPLDWSDFSISGKPETKWSQHGVSENTISDSCDEPVIANIKLIPAIVGEICLDVAATDGLGNIGNRYGYETGGACLTIDNP